MQHVLKMYVYVVVAVVLTHSLVFLICQPSADILRGRPLRVACDTGILTLLTENYQNGLS